MNSDETIFFLSHSLVILPSNSGGVAHRPRIMIVCIKQPKSRLSPATSSTDLNRLFTALI